MINLIAYIFLIIYYIVYVMFCLWLYNKSQIKNSILIYF